MTIMALTQWLISGKIQLRSPSVPGLPNPSEAANPAQALAYQAANDAVEPLLQSVSRKTKRGEYNSYNEEFRAKIARYYIIGLDLSNVVYCSEKCLQMALSSYHRVLCMGSSRNDPEHPLSRLQEAWRNIHYPPETASIMLLIKMVAMVKQAKNKEEAIQLFSQFVRATVNEEEQIAHKLLGAEFKDQLEILRQLSVEAFYEEAVQQWFTPEGFQSLFALIGTNGQGIGTSSVGVWARNCDALELPEEEKAELDKFIDKLYDDLDRVSGTFLNSEGSGLYKLQSACNHSCVPNAEIRFPHNNHILSLVALKDIAPEEEICISYLDECERERSRHSRQKYLRDNYLFSCSCGKCLAQADDPDITSEEEEEEMEEEEEDQ